MAQINPIFDEGLPALAFEALAAAKDLAPTPKNIIKVAELTTEEAARWAFTQLELRASAQSKFNDPSQMLFTREALEQATHEAVARYHASKFPNGVKVADLTCGIGSDLQEMAKRGPVVGFETDIERAACAQFNVPSAEIRVQDCLTAEWGFGYAIADPARRSGGVRLRDPSSFSPDPRSIADQMAALKLGALKLSPLLPDEYLEGLGGRLEFVSFDGECREALVWLGCEASSGRAAVHIESGEVLDQEEVGHGTADSSTFVFEADPAAIRAHCLGTLCQRYGLRELGDSNGFLTGDLEVDSSWLRRFKVLASTPFHAKPLKAELHRMAGPRVELKNRGCKLDSRRWNSELSGPGRNLVYVFVFPVGKSLQAVIAETDFLPKQP